MITGLQDLRRTGNVLGIKWDGEILRRRKNTDGLSGRCMWWTSDLYGSGSRVSGQDLDYSWLVKIPSTDVYIQPQVTGNRGQ